MSQNRRYPQWYSSTPAWRSDPPFRMRSTGSPTGTHMYLALKDLHDTQRGKDPNWVHNCRNGKIGRLGRPSSLGNLGDLVTPSLDSRPLISPLVPCLGVWLAVTLAAYCSPRGWSHGWSMSFVVSTLHIALIQGSTPHRLRVRASGDWPFWPNFRPNFALSQKTGFGTH